MPTDPEALDAICYTHNYLSEVVARVNFATPLDEITDTLPKDLRQLALQKFPIEEPKRAVQHEVRIQREGVTQARGTTFQQWNFHGKKREKQLTITPEFVFVSYKHYKTFEELQDEFGQFIQRLFQLFPETQASRLGLRYINRIVIPSGSPLDWTPFISESLLGLFSFNFEEGEPARIFHNLEIAYDDFLLKFQFGMPNPDHPAPIRQKLFVLDYDAHQSGLIENVTIGRLLVDYHYAIQSLFERSITNRLREMMRE